MRISTHAYGSHPSQIGDLHLPEGPGPHPVVVLAHGGCWWARYRRFLTMGLAADLAARGWAAWNLEYRRLGEDGGGWPGTMLDVAAGVDHLAVLAATHHLDLGTVVGLGHSAGGQLALWAAARHRLAPGAPGAAPAVRLTHVVGLAAMSDLAECARLGTCRGAVVEHFGPPDDPATADRHAVASPVMLLPTGVPTLLVHGTDDDLVPAALSQRYADRAAAAGDDVTLHLVPAARHFEPVQAGSDAWGLVVDWLGTIRPG